MIITMNGSYSYNGKTVDFEYYTGLSAYNKLLFVNEVTNTLVGENYSSIVRDLVFDFYIVDVFTNIDTNSILNNKDVHPISLMENFLENTDIVDIVKENVEYGLLEELNKAINLNIEYKTGIHINKLDDALAKLTNTIEEKIDSIDMSGIDMKSMSEMAQLFAGMSGEFTPENVVRAYLQTDTHKNNLNEIAETKALKDETADIKGNIDKE